MAYTLPKLTDYSDVGLLRAAVEFRLALAIESFELQEQTIDPALSSSDRQSKVKAFRDRWLGRRAGLFGQANELWLKGAPPNHKKQVGRLVNQLKQKDVPAIERLLEHQGFFARQSSEAIAATNRIYDDSKGKQLQAQGLSRYERDKSLFLNVHDRTQMELEQILAQEFYIDWRELLTSAADSGPLEAIDITLPGVRRPIGAEHPVVK